MNTRSLRQLKGKRPIVAVTAYDTLMATLADRAEVDLILVGDSVGTTMLGFDSTVPVTLEMMRHHTSAVARARPNALLVADMPFPLAHQDFPRLLDACAGLMQDCGAEAVKLEGGRDMADKVKRLVDAGIPVMGHIGLLPQRFHAMGGYRKFGKGAEEVRRLEEDAHALQEAGIFALITEMIDPPMMASLCESLQVPVIGIGCGPDCDGQILVCTDLLGMGVGYVPTFAKQYAQLSSTIEQAFRQYGQEVREHQFPATNSEA